MDPDQTAPKEAVRSGYKMFGSIVHLYVSIFKLVIHVR